MTQQGNFHDNPITGEQVVVLTDPRVRDDEVLVAHMIVTPGGRVAAAHHHPNITERFFVLEGQVGFLLDGEEVVLGAGEHATINPGTVHDWWQVGETSAEVVVEVVPGNRFSEMVSTMFGLCRDGKSNAEGLPTPPQLGLLATEYRDVMVLESPSAIVQRLTLPLFALIGRLRGLEPHYEKYMEGAGPVDIDPRALATLDPNGRLRSFD